MVPCCTASLMAAAAALSPSGLCACALQAIARAAMAAMRIRVRWLGMMTSLLWLDEFMQRLPA
ncbi:hypothetical protein D3C81_2263520 [compost metagenome]